MLVYKQDGTFEKRADFKEFLFETIKEHYVGYEAALRRMGFLKQSRYYSQHDTLSFGIDVYSSFLLKDSENILRGYDYLVHVNCAGYPNTIVMESIVELLAFLKYSLPIIKIAGELKLEEG